MAVLQSILDFCRRESTPAPAISTVEVDTQEIDERDARLIEALKLVTAQVNVYRQGARRVG